MRFLNVVVADDHPIFVEGLQAVLSKSEDRFICNIRGIAKNGNQISSMLREMPADLLLMDLNLPETDGLKMLPFVKKGFSGTRVLIMSMLDDPRMVKAAFRAGADGFMLKSGTKDELLQAIDAIVSGRTFVGNGVSFEEQRGASTMPRTVEPDKKFARRFGLTRREMEIMSYIGQALNNKEIAGKLFISDQTVSVHRKNIMRKLNVNSTATLIKMAFENNLV